MIFDVIVTKKPEDSMKDVPGWTNGAPAGYSFEGDIFDSKENKIFKKNAKFIIIGARFDHMQTIKVGSIIRVKAKEESGYFHVDKFIK